VREQDIDAVALQTGEAGLVRSADRVRAIIEARLERIGVGIAMAQAAPLGDRIEQAADLGRDEDLGIAQRLTQPPFGKTEAVKGRRVEIGDAQIQRGPDRRLGLRVRHRRVEIAERGRADPEPRKRHVVHEVTL